MAGKKDILYSKSFEKRPDVNEYEFQLKRSSRWWLWVLLALALLLLCCVKCERSITVTTVDAVSGAPVVTDSVTIDYTSHFLVKDWKIFANHSEHRAQIPDSTGTATFTGLPCSVFSYIFYAFSNADFRAWSECYDLDPSPATDWFHFTSHKELQLVAKTADVMLTVTDRETGDELADATVEYSFVISGSEVNDSAVTDAAGRCTIAKAPVCGELKIRRVSCFAYHDTTDVVIDMPDAMTDPDKMVIPLTPVKESFTFFVHNVFTRQPIPDAKVEIVLKSKKDVVRHGPVSTNVDGKGRGAYADAFVGAVLELHASKTNYRDSSYTPVCTVKEFIERPDSQRVIFLQPLPYVQPFVNLDSITRKPIAGVKNHIEVHSIDGNNYVYDETSNRMGSFSVRAIEGDELLISSRLDGLYEPKVTKIDHFEHGDTILMKPLVTDLVFRTVDKITGAVLPSCDLDITDSRGNSYKPDNSGSGVFTVKNVPLNAELSIIADKAGYDPNDFTIRKADVKMLMKAPQSKRDIPLMKELPPCNGGSVVPKTGLVHQQAYNMGTRSGTASIWTDFKGEPDYLSVYDGPDTSYPILVNKKKIPQFDLVTFTFTNSVITVVVETSPTSPSSDWEYKVNCP